MSKVNHADDEDSQLIATLPGFENESANVEDIVQEIKPSAEVVKETNDQTWEDFHASLLNVGVEADEEPEQTGFSDWLEKIGEEQNAVNEMPQIPELTPLTFNGTARDVEEQHVDRNQHHPAGGNNLNVSSTKAEALLPPGSPLGSEEGRPSTGKRREPHLDATTHVASRLGGQVHGAAPDGRHQAVLPGGGAGQLEDGSTGRPGGLDKGTTKELNASRLQRVGLLAEPSDDDDDDDDGGDDAPDGGKAPVHASGTGDPGEELPRANVGFSLPGEPDERVSLRDERALLKHQSLRVADEMDKEANLTSEQRHSSQRSSGKSRGVDMNVMGDMADEGAPKGGGLKARAGTRDVSSVGAAARPSGPKQSGARASALKKVGTSVKELRSQSVLSVSSDGADSMQSIFARLLGNRSGGAIEDSDGEEEKHETGVNDYVGATPDEKMPKKLRLPNLNTAIWDDLVHAVTWCVGRAFGFQAFNMSPSTSQFTRHEFTPATIFVASDHLTHLLVKNGYMRRTDATEDPMGDTDKQRFGRALLELHSTIFYSYEVQWCKHVQLPVRVKTRTEVLREAPFWHDTVIHGLLCELCLYFLIYTESANARHCPEILWFLYWCLSFSPVMETLWETPVAASQYYRARQRQPQLRNKHQGVIYELQHLLAICATEMRPEDLGRTKLITKRLRNTDVPTADRTLVADLVAWGDGGYFTDHVITPIFYVMSYEIDHLGTLNVETAHRLGYDDFNESLATKDIVWKALADLKVSREKVLSCTPNSAYMLMTNLGYKSKEVVDTKYDPQVAAEWWRNVVFVKTYRERRTWAAVYRAYFRVYALQLCIFFAQLCIAFYGWDWRAISATIPFFCLMKTMERCANWYMTRTPREPLETALSKILDKKGYFRPLGPKADEVSAHMSAQEQPTNRRQLLQKMHETNHTSGKATQSEKTQIYKLAKTVQTQRHFRIEGTPLYGIFGIVEWPLIFGFILAWYIIQFKDTPSIPRLGPLAHDFWMFFALIFVVYWFLHFLITTRDGYCISLTEALGMPDWIKIMSSRPNPVSWLTAPMKMQWPSFFQNAFFWVIVFAMKIPFDYFVLAKPTVLPVLAMLERNFLGCPGGLNDSYKIGALELPCLGGDWILIFLRVAPFVVIVLFDTSLFYQITVTLFGMYHGLFKLDLGVISTWDDLVNAFHGAPSRWWDRCMSELGNQNQKLLMRQRVVDTMQFGTAGDSKNVVISDGLMFKVKLITPEEMRSKTKKPKSKGDAATDKSFTSNLRDKSFAASVVSMFSRVSHRRGYAASRSTGISKVTTVQKRMPSMAGAQLMRGVALQQEDDERMSNSFVDTHGRFAVANPLALAKHQAMYQKDPEEAESHGTAGLAGNLARSFKRVATFSGVKDFTGNGASSFNAAELTEHPKLRHTAGPETTASKISNAKGLRMGRQATTSFSGRQSSFHAPPSRASRTSRAPSFKAAANPAFQAGEGRKSSSWFRAVGQLVQGNRAAAAAAAAEEEEPDPPSPVSSSSQTGAGFIMGRFFSSQSNDANVPSDISHLAGSSAAGFRGGSRPVAEGAGFEPSGGPIAEAVEERTSFVQRMMSNVSNVSPRLPVAPKAPAEEGDEMDVRVKKTTLAPPPTGFLNRMLSGGARKNWGHSNQVKPTDEEHDEGVSKWLEEGRGGDPQSHDSPFRGTPLNDVHRRGTPHPTNAGILKGKSGAGVSPTPAALETNRSGDGYEAGATGVSAATLVKAAKPTPAPRQRLKWQDVKESFSSKPSETPMSRLDSNASFMSGALPDDDAEDEADAAFDEVDEVGEQIMMWNAFAMAWDEVVSDLRVADYISNHEVDLLKFVRLEDGKALGLRPILLPTFFYAGQIRKVVDTGFTEPAQIMVLSELRVLLVWLGCQLGFMSGKHAHVILKCSLFSGTINVKHMSLRKQAFDALVTFMTQLEAMCKRKDVPYDVQGFADKLNLVLKGVESECYAVYKAREANKMEDEDVASASTLLEVVQEMAADLRKDPDAIRLNLRLAVKGNQSDMDPESILKVVTTIKKMLITAAAQATPGSEEAQRILGFFVNSLNHPALSRPSELLKMRSWSILTPAYEEDVLYALETKQAAKELHLEPKKGLADLLTETTDNFSTMAYLRSMFPEEWDNFKERIATMPNSPQDIDYKAVTEVDFAPGGVLYDMRTEIQLWASYRGQLLARTVRGMMCYEQGIRVLCRMEHPKPHGVSEKQYQQFEDTLVQSKFEYVVAVQTYGRNRSSNDLRLRWLAHAVDILIDRFPSMKVAFLDSVKLESAGPTQFSVLVRMRRPDDPVVMSGAIDQPPNPIFEAYRVRMPYNRYSHRGIILGEGKPENQNHSTIFTFGEGLQAIDMNQDNNVAEAVKMRNLTGELAAGGMKQDEQFCDQLENGKGLQVNQFTTAAELRFHIFTRMKSTIPVSIVGFREWIFSDKTGALGRFAAATEYAFSTIQQRTMEDPGRVRMHYGHPDIFNKLYCMTRGGISKGTRNLHISEDVFCGINLTLRGSRIRYKEYISVGKGRDMGFESILGYQKKISGGSGELATSREAARAGARLDLFRLLHLYHAGVGHFLNSYLTAVAIYWNAYVLLFLAMAGASEISTTSATGEVSVTNTYSVQQILQLGTLAIIPYIGQLILEVGLLKAVLTVLGQIITGSLFFYMFQQITVAAAFSSDMMYGSVQYIATGRGFSITTMPFVRMYASYARTHLYLGFELIFFMTTLYIIDDCQTCNYPALTWNTWFMGFVLVIAPFWFNPFVFDVTKANEFFDVWQRWIDGDVDVNTGSNWYTWNRSELQKARNDNGNITDNWVNIGKTLLVDSSKYMILAIAAIDRMDLRPSTPQSNAPPPAALMNPFVQFLVASTTMYTLAGATLWARQHMTRLTLQKQWRIVRWLLFIVLLIFFLLYIVALKVAGAVDNSISELFGVLALFMFANLMVLIAVHKASTCVYSQNNVIRDFCDSGYYVIDHAVGYLMFFILLIMSFVGIFQLLQSKLLFNESFSQDVAFSRIHNAVKGKGKQLKSKKGGGGKGPDDGKGGGKGRGKGGKSDKEESDDEVTSFYSIAETLKQKQKLLKKKADAPTEKTAASVRSLGGFTEAFTSGKTRVDEPGARVLSRANSARSLGGFSEYTDLDDDDDDTRLGGEKNSGGILTADMLKEADSITRGDKRPKPIDTEPAADKTPSPTKTQGESGTPQLPTIFSSSWASSPKREPGSKESSGNQVRFPAVPGDEDNLKVSFQERPAERSMRKLESIRSQGSEVGSGVRFGGVVHEDGKVEVFEPASTIRDEAQLK